MSLNETDGATQSSLRNPVWGRDELILALDLYIRHKPSLPGPRHSDVVTLSELLNRIGRLNGSAMNTVFRNPSRLRIVAASIEASLPILEEAPAEAVNEHDEAEEGAVLTRLHRYRERDRGIIERRKAQGLKEHGTLACEACGFDFLRSYGARGDGFIECHHTVPVSSLKPGDRTRLAELVLLCANCHRMVHVSRPWLTIDDLRQQIAVAGRVK